MLEMNPLELIPPPVLANPPKFTLLVAELFPERVADRQNELQVYYVQMRCCRLRLARKQP